MLAGEPLDAELHHPPRLVLRDDQRPEEVVPVGQEEEHRQRGQHRPRERQDDVPVHAHQAGAVHDGGFLELERDRQIELAEQEDPEGVRDHGHDEAQVAVHPSQPVYDDE